MIIKYLFTIFFLLFTTFLAIGQPDTLYFTSHQKHTFESILDSFREKKMDIDEIYLENKRFDSLIRIIDKMNDSRRSAFEDKDSIYRIAKTIYPYSWKVSFWKDPTRCFFRNDIIERTQERLRDFCKLSSHLRLNGINDGLSKKQLYQVHEQQMDRYLIRLKHASQFIDTNLEGRLWAHLYFDSLEKTHITIIDEQK